jgi:hypothetical protein
MNAKQKYLTSLAGCIDRTESRLAKEREKPIPDKPRNRREMSQVPFWEAAVVCLYDLHELYCIVPVAHEFWRLRDDLEIRESPWNVMVERAKRLTGQKDYGAAIIEHAAIVSAKAHAPHDTSNVVPFARDASGK